LLAASLVALAVPLAYERASAVLVSELLLQAAFTCLLAFIVWAILGAARQMRLELVAKRGSTT
jgi:hypothetical protein